MLAVQRIGFRNFPKPDSPYESQVQAEITFRAQVTVDKWRALDAELSISDKVKDELVHLIWRELYGELLAPARRIAWLASYLKQGPAFNDPSVVELLAAVKTLIELLEPDL